MYHEFLFALAGASAAGIGIQLLALNPARRRIATLEARIALTEKRGDRWFRDYQIAIAQRDALRAQNEELRAFKARRNMSRRQREAIAA
ncbi:hypothetical protein [Rhizorhabdus histidinilytica]|uniref:Uncharacterized protein n=1 Tax=Rhizorhabdus histidinilytica TaxID=439228 RepID=A0A1T5A868_9SPHN|nr:hypothetical protein [Rhizorhabdus histidinilytica]SKB31201.1 hypothetical protein SAMN06295920_101697 [Rhizorhabdus histidinilytica]